jgi:hypothetical protein
MRQTDEAHTTQPTIVSLTHLSTGRQCQAGMLAWQPNTAHPVQQQRTLDRAHTQPFFSGTHLDERVILPEVEHDVRAGRVRKGQIASQACRADRAGPGSKKAGVRSQGGLKCT